MHMNEQLHGISSSSSSSHRNYFHQSMKRMNISELRQIFVYLDNSTLSTIQPTASQCEDVYEQFDSHRSVVVNVYNYAVLVLGVLSVLVNLLNLIILTRHHMLSPSNVLLTGIALCDLCIALVQTCFLTYERHIVDETSYAAVVVFLVCNYVSLTCHIASNWLGVFLATFRYFYIHYAASRVMGNHQGLSKRCHISCSWCFSRCPWWPLAPILQARLCFIAVYGVLMPLLVPYYLSAKIVAQGNASYAPQSIYWSEFHEQYTFLMAAVGGKILPCVLIMLFIVLLLNSLKVVLNRRKSLLPEPHLLPQVQPSRRELLPMSHPEPAISFVMGCSQAGDAVPVAGNQQNRRSRRNRDHQRTTRLLIAVIAVYLVTELPPGIVLILSRTNMYFKCIYRAWGDALDFCSLLKNVLVFSLYCSMSSEYRDTLRILVCRHRRLWVARWRGWRSRSLPPNMTSRAETAMTEARKRGRASLPCHYPHRSHPGNAPLRVQIHPPPTDNSKRHLEEEIDHLKDPQAMVSPALPLINIQPATRSNSRADNDRNTSSDTDDPAGMEMSPLLLQGLEGLTQDS